MRGPNINKYGERIETISEGRKAELDAQYSLDPHDYLIFGNQVGHPNEENKVATSIEAVIAKYIKSVDKIIGVMDGTIRERDLVDPDPEKTELSQEAPDVVVYLDKSARPVQWFVKEFWPYLAEGEASDGDGSPRAVKKPEEKFLNIDRTNWLYQLGQQNEGQAVQNLTANDFDLSKAPQEYILGIRAIFAEKELSEDNWREEVLTVPNLLDGKKILIVDEVKTTGATLAISQQLIKAAFPDAVVSGAYFWEPGIKNVDQQTNKKQKGLSPVWYNKEDVFGRGVGNRDFEYYEQKAQAGEIPLNIALGRVALSTPHRKDGEFVKDTWARGVRDEIKKIRQDYEAGKIYPFHSMERLRNAPYVVDRRLKERGMNTADFRYINSRK